MNLFVLALSCAFLASTVQSLTLHKKDDTNGTENASKKVLWSSFYKDNVSFLCDCRIACRT